MLKAKNISLFFGQRAIFKDVSFNLNSNQRVGLVGRNGSGKTTLLKVISGIQGVDSGDIEIQKNKKIAYMPQDVVLLSEKTILDEALAVFDNLDEVLHRVKKLEEILETSHDDSKKVEEYSELQSKLIDLDFENRIIETKKILKGLGFSKEQLNSKVTTLSVGWKMRLVLAKLLLQKADFYLFDEPTNHLDLVAKDWFLDFLKNSNFGFVLICHDKYFLDHLCEQIYAISLGDLKVYKGNYSAYEVQSEKDLENQEKKYLEQQKYIKKQMDLVNRFRASATKAKMAQSILKSLEKLEKVEVEHKQKTVRFRFGEIKRSGKIVLQVKDLAKSFGDKKIFNNSSFEVERGEKVAIVAPNGVGKTTLLNIVMGKIKQDNGLVNFGHNVEPAFFEQDQNLSLDLSKSILNEVEDSCKTSESRQRVRGYLGSFLFSGDDVDKRISVLSGGEKNRVAMVKVLLQDANFLILDEPTNHLDIQSKEVLLNVLNSFEGTILFVSHDRDFLNNLATHIVDLSSEFTAKFSGNYDSFLFQKNEAQLKASGKSETKNGLDYGDKSEKDKKIKNKKNHEERKKIRNLESKIDRLEKALVDLPGKLDGLEYGTEEFNNILSQIKENEQKLEEALQLWENLNN